MFNRGGRQARPPSLPFRPHESTYPFPARRLHPDDRSGRLASRRETGAPAHARRDEHGRRAAELPRRSGAVQRARIGPRLPTAAPGREAENRPDGHLSAHQTHGRRTLHSLRAGRADRLAHLLLHERRPPALERHANPVRTLRRHDLRRQRHALFLDRRCRRTGRRRPAHRLLVPRREGLQTQRRLWNHAPQEPRQRSHLVRRRDHLRRHQLGTLSVAAARRTHSVLLHRLSARHPQFGDLGNHLHGQRPHLARTHARLPAVQVRRQGRADLHRPDALLPPAQRR